MKDLKKPRFRGHITELVSSVSKDRERSLYFPREAQKYADYPLLTSGTENIPRSGPIILLINHYNHGPDNGIWTYSTVSKTVADNTGDGWKRRYRFIVKDEYERPIKQNGLISRVNTDIIQPRATHILKNTSEAADAIATNGDGNEIIKTIKNGDILATFPAGVPEYELSKGIEDVATLIKLGLRYNATVIPVGAYHRENKRSGTEEKLYLTFGKPITKEEIARIKDKQELVDHAMVRIGLLLPSQMHGVYAQKVRETQSRISFNS